MTLLMNSSSTEGRPIRIASAGHVAFATIMIALGIMGLVVTSNEDGTGG